MFAVGNTGNEQNMKPKPVQNCMLRVVQKHNCCQMKDILKEAF